MDVLKSALKHVTRDALIVGNQTYSYQTLLINAIQVCKKLKEFWLASAVETKKCSPTVGIYFEPGFEYVATTWGTWMAGGIVVPLAASHTQRELRYVIEDANIGIIETTEEWKSKLPSSCNSEIHSFSRDLNKDRGELSFPTPGKNDGALIMYTSGTTGKPKGVLHTHFSLNAQMKSLSEAWGWRKEDCILHTLPLHHIHGIVNALYCAHYNGACVRILPKFSPNAVWKYFKSENISVFMAVPTMYSHLISYFRGLTLDEQETLKVKSQKLRLYVSGSAACPVPIMMQWREITGQWILERYGMTEIGMALSNPLFGERRPGHVGTPLPGVVVKISPESEDGGELLVKGDTLFKEYWNLPEITRTSFDHEGYFKTGDTVALSGSPPYFKILGRTSVDIIKCGGYKLSALEIESVILEDSRIKECCIVGIEDEVYGEIPVAVINKGEDMSEVTPSEIIEFCKTRLAKYKAPKEVVFMSCIPRNAMGKINKKEIIKHIQTKPNLINS